MVESFDELGLKLLIKIDTLPVLKDVKWEDIELEKLEAEIKEEDIEEMKNKLLKSTEY